MVTSPRDNIPLALLGNDGLCELVKQLYQHSIPPMIDNINNAETFGVIEDENKKLATDIISPWESYSPPKAERYRPGWTRRLDWTAKRLTQILQTGFQIDKLEDRKLDRDIKREL